MVDHPARDDRDRGAVTVEAALALCSLVLVLGAGRRRGGGGRRRRCAASTPPGSWPGWPPVAKPSAAARSPPSSPRPARGSSSRYRGDTVVAEVSVQPLGRGRSRCGSAGAPWPRSSRACGRTTARDGATGDDGVAHRVGGRGVAVIMARAGVRAASRRRRRGPPSRRGGGRSGRARRSRAGGAAAGRLACARAEEIATEMNGLLTECEIAGWEAQVTVRCGCRSRLSAGTPRQPAHAPGRPAASHTRFDHSRRAVGRSGRAGAAASATNPGPPRSPAR